MRLSLLSLLLLSTATAATAQSSPDEPAEQVQADRTPERRASPPPRPERMERPERQFRDVDRSPLRPERMEQPEPQFRAVDRSPPPPPPPPAPSAERAEGFEPRAVSPQPVRDIAAAEVRERRRETWNRPTAEAPTIPNAVGAAPGWDWRGSSGERRVRSRDIPPSSASPSDYGSGVQGRDRAVQTPRDVPPGGVNASNLRDRIAAEGLRRDRLENDRWRQDWRQDRRYDWRRYRDRDRSRFHLGIYIDPFGGGYRDYDIGWRLPARYYVSRYWIIDPWYYRLPPVGGDYRWVRYHNDVLLVDLRSGRVLDRIRGFFW